MFANQEEQQMARAEDATSERSSSGGEDSGGEEASSSSSSDRAQRSASLMSNHFAADLPKVDDYNNVDDWVRDMLRYALAIDDAKADSFQPSHRADKARE